jgi:outer membrane protein assembly factor BamB
VHVENQNTSFAAGIDVETGANRWRMDRPREPNWTTPVILPGKAPAADLVLLQGPTRLSAVEPGTGKEVWHLDRDSHPIASAAVAGDILYVPGGTGLTALELRPDGPPKVVWEKPKLGPGFSSPVVLGGRVYVLRGSVLVAGDARTGEVVGQLRLRGSAYSASIVAAGGLLYCFSEDGQAQAVQAGDKGPVLLDGGTFGETILCTPAVAGGALYVRSDKHLWKIAD